MTAIAVTLAGSDSGGGAGIQADLKTFSALGVYGASVVTALTAQNTRGVQAIHEVPAEFVTRQIESVFSDLTIGAVKIGMLSRPEVILAVADGLARRGTITRQRQAQADLVAAAQASYAIGEARYREGSDSFLTALVAQRTLYSAQQTAISAALTDLANRVTLYQAIGSDDTL